MQGKDKVRFLKKNLDLEFLVNSLFLFCSFGSVGYIISDSISLVQQRFDESIEEGEEKNDSCLLMIVRATCLLMIVKKKILKFFFSVAKIQHLGKKSQKR